MQHMQAAILDAMPEPVFLLMADQTILFANHAAASLFGDDLLGNGFVRAMRHPEALKCVEMVVRGAEASQVTVTITRPISTMFRLRAVRLKPQKSGEPLLIITLNDVTHVQEAEQMRSDFIANLSHELKSPLTALIGFIETIKGPARDDVEARDHFLDVMAREADRMNRLINDLLSLSKVEVKKRIRPEKPVHIENLVRGVIDSLSGQLAHASKTIVLNVAATHSIVPGDYDELVQVFHNLIENALKYGAAGTNVEVDIANLRESAGIRGSALSISVRDKGDGIPREHIPRLTERFYRVDDHRSREKGGTGLGLAIVKHIVNRHRGRLQVRSVQGEGSSFTVILPATLESDVVAVDKIVKNS